MVFLYGIMICMTCIYGVKIDGLGLMHYALKLYGDIRG